MAGKVVSIKIGYSVTQIAEIDHETKNPRVYHAFSVETPDGVLDDTGVHVTEEFVNLIKHGMEDAGIQNNRAIFTMSSTRVATRDIQIPLVKEAKIRPLLIANSKDYFPVDLSQYQLVYRVIEKLKEQKQMKLTVFAVPNALVDSYQAMAKALGLQLVAIDYYGNSIYQAMINSMNSEVAATICIEDNNSMITIIKNGHVALQRSIGYGIDDAVRTMQESSLVKRGTTYLDALGQMQMNLSFAEQLKPRTTGESGEEGAHAMNTKEQITRSLTMLIGNISRVLDYFVSRNSDVELTDIYLVGLGADCVGLDKLLSNELGIHVETIRRFGSSDVTRELSAQRFHLGEYYACIGTAIHPLNFIFAVDEQKAESESLTVAALVCAGGVLISIAIILTGVFSNMFVRSEIRTLEDSINSKKGAIEVYNNYVTQTAIRDEFVTMDSMTISANSAFLSFLSQMEEKMPSDILVSSLSASDEGISMSVTTNSKASAAEAIIQLRSFTGIGNITCTGISETTDENGKTTDSFQVSVVYVEEEAADEEQQSQN